MAKFVYFEQLETFLEFGFHEFEWDRGNSLKIQLKHSVSPSEVEEVFFDENLVVLGKQVSPFASEPRYGVLGKTLKSKILFICFTLRNEKIRVISARLASSKERGHYEE